MVISRFSISVTDMPLAQRPSTKEPMLVPAITSTGTRSLLSILRGNVQTPGITTVWCETGFRPFFEGAVTPCFVGLSQSVRNQAQGLGSG
jgi:hypothetical protein